MSVELDPKDWGWKQEKGQYIPVATDQAIGPEEVLNVIRCQCKTPCSSGQCSCRKHGLQCVAACKYCYGETCENATQVEPIDIADIEDENEFEHEDEGSPVDFILDDLDIECMEEEVIETV